MARFGYRRPLEQILVAITVLLICGCQTTQVPTNEPLPQNAQGMPEYRPGYALIPMLQQPQGEIVFIMAFSGGGKRSAAFAHGVLRGLRHIPVVEDGGTRRLLDELDYVAAVSGGSFPAMHYGLYRDKSFETFPSEFLKVDINAFVYGTYLFPWNWEWLVNPYYGTNDRMAEIYDRLMFHGATYADLLRQGLPLVSVNATDIANGISFAFTQPSFDLICSDLSRFPVARAVAASNGFPVLFSPITLISHTTDCRGVRPPTAAPAEWAEAPGELSRRALLARIANRYLDPERTKYIHLMDGGISDNLALRGVVNGGIALDDTAEYISPGRAEGASGSHSERRRSVGARPRFVQAARRHRSHPDLRCGIRNPDRRLQFRDLGPDRPRAAPIGRERAQGSVRPGTGD